MRIKNCFFKYFLLFLFMATSLCFTCYSASATILQIPVSTKIIESEAFYGNSTLDEVILSDNIEQIGEKAFADSSVKTINLPDSLKYISETAFDHSNDITFIVNEGSYADKWLMDWRSKDISPAPVDDFTFQENGDGTCTLTGYYGQRKNFVLPSENADGLPISIIGEKAFYNSELQYVKIPVGVKELGSQAFSSCGQLQEVDLPEGLTTIGDNCFSSCGALMHINIPESVTYIGSWSFMYCGSLKSIYIPKGVTTVNYLSFMQCGLERVVLSEGIECIGGSAFDGCSQLKSINFPDTLQRIEGSAFAGCYSLSVVQLPDNLVSIGGSAFSGSAIKSIRIPKNITIIADSTFRSCHSLHTVLLPDGLTNIESRAFYDCEYLSSIILPKTLKYIGYQAFYNCSLSTLCIPENMEKIDDQAFLYVYLQYIYVKSPDCILGQDSIGSDSRYSMKKIYCKNGSNAWQWFSGSYFSSFLTEWSPDQESSNDVIVSGKVMIGNTPANSVSVYAVNSKNEVEKISITDQNGRWSTQLERGNSYFLVYSLPDYDVISGITSITTFEDTDIGTVMLAMSNREDDRVSFFMSSENSVVGEVIHFQIFSTISNEVRFIADGIPYEYITLENGTAFYDRVFHNGGERRIQFSAEDDEGTLHISDAQVLKLESNGTLESPIVSPPGDQILEHGFYLSWSTVPNATEYSVYVYGPYGRIWPVSAYYTEESTTTDTTIWIPGEYLNVSGKYTVDVIAFGKGFSQSSGSVDFSLYDTGSEASISFPYDGAEFVVCDPLLVAAIAGKNSTDVQLGVSVNGAEDILYESNAMGRFELNTDNIGRYILTPYATTDGSTYKAITSQSINIIIRAPQISKLKQDNYPHTYKRKGSTLTFTGSSDDNTTIEITCSDGQCDTLTLDQGVTEFNWTSDPISESGLYTFNFTPMRNDISGEAKEFHVAITEDLDDVYKYTTTVSDVCEFPGGSVKDCLARGVKVKVTEICGDYSLVKYDNLQSEGFILSQNLTLDYIEQDSDRILRIVSMDPLPEYVNTGNEKTYGVVTTADITAVIATVSSIYNKRSYTFDLLFREEWELEYPTSEKFFRFTCKIPILDASVNRITWTARDSLGNSYPLKSASDEQCDSKMEEYLIIGYQNSSLYSENTQLYIKRSDLKLQDTEEQTILTITNPTDFRIVFLGETLLTVNGRVFYCLQITNKKDESISYGIMADDIVECSLTTKPTDGICKRGIIIAAHMDEKSKGDFNQDCGSTNMGYAIQIYHAAGITNIKTVSGPSTNSEIKKQIEPVFKECDYNDILYITIIAHGGENLDGTPITPLAWKLYDNGRYDSSDLNILIDNYAHQIGELHLIIDSCYAGTYSYNFQNQPPVFDALLSTTGFDKGWFVKNYEGKLLCNSFILSLYEYMTHKFHSRATLSQLCSGTYNYVKYIDKDPSSLWSNLIKVRETKPSTFIGESGSNQNVFFDTAVNN